MNYNLQLRVYASLFKQSPTHPTVNSSVMQIASACLAATSAAEAFNGDDEPISIGLGAVGRIRSARRVDGDLPVAPFLVQKWLGCSY